MKKPFIIVFVVASAIAVTSVLFRPDTATTSLPMQEDSVGTSMSAAKQVSDKPL